MALSGPPLSLILVVVGNIPARDRHVVIVVILLFFFFEAGTRQLLELSVIEKRLEWLARFAALEVTL